MREWDEPSFQFKVSAAKISIRRAHLEILQELTNLLEQDAESVP